MKKLHKQYVLLSMVFSSFIFGMYLFSMYIIDPAGINNKFNLGLIKDSGVSYRTQKFVEINEVKPNTLMLGGSRIHYLNSADVQKYTNDKVYNLALPSSTLEEQYYFLKYSIEKFNIKNVVIGINLYPFSEKLQKNSGTDFDKTIFTDGFTLQRQFKYYLEMPFIKYAKNYYNKKWEKDIYFNGGRTAYFQKIIIGNKSWKEREKSNKAYKKVYTNYLVWGNKGLNILKDMVKLCRDNDINLKVFTTGIYISQLQILENINKMDIYYTWQKEIAKITPYYDFMYPNSITKNSDNYIDPSHMKQEKGYLYFAKIFKDTKVKVPDDFGIYVDKNNIDKHLMFLKKQSNKL